MKRYIELHMDDTNYTVLVNIDNISYVYDDSDNGVTMVCFAGDDDDYVVVTERYGVVKKMIDEAMKR